MDRDEMSRCRRRSPATVPPLEDDNLLPEILLRLPPQPSSLPRASLVSKRWLSLVTSPRFIRRFRIHHRRSKPPLLGFFKFCLNFLPAMEAPNRLPEGRFSLQRDDPYVRRRLVGCRHGLVLVYLPPLLQFLVWDPVTGDQHRIAIPPGVAPLDKDTWIHGAVLRTDGDVQHFHVIMVATVQEGGGEDNDDDSEEEEEEQHNGRAFAQVYSSETGTWGDLISAPIPSDDVLSPTVLNTEVPAVLVGDSLYWFLCDNLLKFDLYRQRLSVIDKPPRSYERSLMRADGGELGYLTLLNSSARLWKRKTDCDGVTKWVLARTIRLDKLLSLSPEKTVRLQGFAEENNVVLVWTQIGLFTIQLDTLEFRKIDKTKIVGPHYAFESLYAAGTVIGDRHDGAELLPET